MNPQILSREPRQTLLSAPTRLHHRLPRTPTHHFEERIAHIPHHIPRHFDTWHESSVACEPRASRTQDRCQVRCLASRAAEEPTRNVQRDPTQSVRVLLLETQPGQGATRRFFVSHPLESVANPRCQHACDTRTSDTNTKIHHLLRRIFARAWSRVVLQ